MVERDQKERVLPVKGKEMNQWQNFLAVVSQWSAKDPIWDEVEDFITALKEISKEKDEEILKFYGEVEEDLTYLARDQKELIVFFMFSSFDDWKIEILGRQVVEEVSKDLHLFLTYLKDYGSLHEKKPQNVTERRDLSNEKDRLEELINPLFEKIDSFFQEEKDDKMDTHEEKESEEELVNEKGSFQEEDFQGQLEEKELQEKDEEEKETTSFEEEELQGQEEKEITPDPEEVESKEDLSDKEEKKESLWHLQNHSLVEIQEEEMKEEECNL